MKVAVLKKLPAAIHTAKQHEAVAKKAMELADKAVSKENFSLAKQLNELAVQEGRNAKEPQLVAQATKRISEIERSVASFEAARAAAKVLEQKPDDPEANLTVGKYKCFVKADWEHGLPMLALGSDAGLRAVAAKELEGATSAEAQVAMGDAWWDLAEKEDPSLKEQLQGRAAYWYRKALPELSGLTKDKVEKRAKESNPIQMQGPKSTQTVLEWRRGWKLDAARIVNNYVRLDRSSSDEHQRGEDIGVSSLVTERSYGLPLVVSIVARTNGTNIRVSYGRARVIWNWEERQNEMRVHRLDTTLASAKVLPIQPGVWYKLRWSITKDAMSVFVNGRLVFTERQHNVLTEKSSVRIYNSHGSVVDVQEASVKAE